MMSLLFTVFLATSFLFFALVETFLAMVALPVAATIFAVTILTLTGSMTTRRTVTVVALVAVRLREAG